MKGRALGMASLVAAAALGGGVLVALVSAYRIGLACLARGPL